MDIKENLILNEKHIASVIKRGRKRINKRQEQLAEELGLNVSTISRYESGKTVIPAPYLEEISRLCRFNPVNYFRTVKKPTEMLNNIASNLGYKFDCGVIDDTLDKEADVVTQETLSHLEWLSEKASGSPELFDREKVNLFIDNTLIEIEHTNNTEDRSKARIYEYWKRLTQKFD